MGEVEDGGGEVGKHVYCCALNFNTSCVHCGAAASASAESGARPMASGRASAGAIPGRRAGITRSIASADIRSVLGRAHSVAGKD